MNKPINITDPDNYEYGKPQFRARTKQRLSEIIDCGMTEVGYGEFGCKGILSGFYIEKVWSYSDEAFKNYMDWAKEVITRKNS